MQKHKKCNSLSLRGNDLEKFVNPRNASIAIMKHVKTRNHCNKDFELTILKVIGPHRNYRSKSNGHVIFGYSKMVGFHHRLGNSRSQSSKNFELQGASHVMNKFRQSR